MFKTSAMPRTSTAWMNGVATANDTAGAIMLDADGFSVVGANSNTVNTRYTWIAFAGSNCSATGSFCVGTYIGNATSPRTITTGFQTDLVWVKAATTGNVANWRSSSMSGNNAQFFGATTQDATANYFTALSSTGFTVGATNNATGVAYHYVAFKSVAGAVSVGTYAGNATDNRSITGTGFRPDFVFLKNANAGTAVGAVYSVNESYGDSTSYFSDTANLLDSIQALESNGFQVGANATSNGSSNTVYYAAFGGVAAHSAGSGTFTMASGSYTGTGQYITINNLDFTPDLVIIKGNTAQAGVFRISMMGGDATAYLDSATADFAGGIVSLDAKGFTIGNSAVVNTNAVTYYWTAYGNAWNPETNSGAADFSIGAYYGNGVDSRNITRQPFQPNLAVIKRSGASGGVFRTSLHSGDIASYFTATADAANMIQSFNADGFQVGTGANTNTAAANNWFFTFKTSAKFVLGSYTGSGSSQTISAVGFQPDNLWVKTPTAQYAVMRTSSLSGDGAWPFINTAQIANAITGLTATGFTVNTAAQTNSNTVSYRYMAWKGNGVVNGTLTVDIVDGTNQSVTSPAIVFNPVSFSFDNQVATGTLGTTTEKIRVDNSTTNPQWSLSVAASSPTAFWDGTPADYDFNDLTVGALDGSDADSLGGQMTINPSTGTLTPKGGCNNTGLSLGSAGSFSQGVMDSVTLLTAGASSGTSCYWDLTGVTVSQTIPAGQTAANDYNINMTLTITAI